MATLDQMRYILNTLETMSEGYTDPRQELIDIDRVAYEALVPREFQTPAGAWFIVESSTQLENTHILCIVINDENEGNYCRALPYLPQNRIANALTFAEVKALGFWEVWTP